MEEYLYMVGINVVAKNGKKFSMNFQMPQIKTTQLKRLKKK
jgi:hypothetical protein